MNAYIGLYINIAPKLPIIFSSLPGAYGLQLCTKKPRLENQGGTKTKTNNYNFTYFLAGCAPLILPARQTADWQLIPLLPPDNQ